MAFFIPSNANSSLTHVDGALPVVDSPRSCVDVATSTEENSIWPVSKLYEYTLIVQIVNNSHEYKKYCYINIRPYAQSIF